MYRSSQPGRESLGFYAFIYVAIMLLLAFGCRPLPPYLNEPDTWQGHGKLNGVWALDFRSPSGGQLPTRSWDLDPTDTLMHAVHVIEAVRRDLWGRPTSYRLATIGHGPDGQPLPPCSEWVHPAVFWWEDFPNIASGSLTECRGHLAPSVPWYDEGDTLCVPAVFASRDSVGLRVLEYQGVVPWSF